MGAIQLMKGILPAQVLQMGRYMLFATAKVAAMAFTAMVPWASPQTLTWPAITGWM